LAALLLIAALAGGYTLSTFAVLFVIKIVIPGSMLGNLTELAPLITEVTTLILLPKILALACTVPVAAIPVSTDLTKYVDDNAPKLASNSNFEEPLAVWLEPVAATITGNNDEVIESAVALIVLLGPATPLNPDLPEVPVNPLNPDAPLNPDRPLTPVVPDIPLVPLYPLMPEVPLYPLTPDVPDVPLIPDVPEVPLVPLNPEMPLNPDLPLTPVVPLAPLTPDVPEVPLNPLTPEVPL
jgi:hypothetical protein